MKKDFINQFKSLNKLAEAGGTVIFGGTSDINIPLCELKQAYGLNENYYNRSIENLSAQDASEVYRECISELKPETVFLHIGQADVEQFTVSSDNFVSEYRKLINQIRKDNKKCRIAIVSLAGDSDVTCAMNKQLKYLANSERCEYCDITNQIPCNPKHVREISSFIHNLGFVQPVQCKRPIYDLSRMIFCFE